jgi:hypothetical protein
MHAERGAWDEGQKTEWKGKTRTDQGNHVLPTAGHEVGVLCSATQEARVWSVHPYRRRTRGMCSHIEGESHIDGEKAW